MVASKQVVLLRALCASLSVFTAACGGSGASSTICMQGGTVTITSGPGMGASVLIPANAVTSCINVSLSGTQAPTDLPSGATVAGPAIVANPEGQMFAGNVTLSLPITTSGATVIVYTRPVSGGTWTVVPGAQTGTGATSIPVSVAHFSEFVPAVAPACPTGMQRCSAACVDLTSDPNNCGGCAMTCSSGMCQGGQCIPTCMSGLTYCPNIAMCVNLTSDPTHCSSCFNACSTGQICDFGMCVAAPSCNSPMVMCGSNCVNLQTDVGNCGMCGTACFSPGNTCTSGACAAGTCPLGQLACTGTCVDPLNDAMNCGGCYNACPGTQTCTAGHCM